jgi:DNA-directed RNA polymerase subunit RPC12/RpoP
MSRGVKCPNCGKRGGVVCRKDAFAIFKITEDGGKLIDTWVMDDVDGYHCFKCDGDVEYIDIEEQTNW